MSIFVVKSPIGKYKDENIYNDIVNYITQPKKVKSGYVQLRGISSVKTAAVEMEATAKQFGKDKGTRIRHSVLSFDSTEKIALSEADRVAGKLIDFYSKQGYQIMSAVHEDKEFPHIHMVMNTVNTTDGHKYEGKKKDYYQFQSYAKRVLKSYGVKFRAQKSS